MSISTRELVAIALLLFVAAGAAMCEGFDRIREQSASIGALHGEVQALQRQLSNRENELRVLAQHPYPRCLRLPLSLSGEKLRDVEKLVEDIKAAVSVKINRDWDQILDVYCVHESERALSGRWSGQSWGWLAWKSGNDWRVAVATEDFLCDDVATIPTEYDEFFYHDTHSIDGELACKRSR